ncbi:MAG: hypothetical protein ACLFWH_11490 [Actinomycetota bacterium]
MYPDWGLGNVWSVSAAGTDLLAEGLAQPEGLALDGDRLVVVEEGKDRVVAIDLDTGSFEVVVEGLQLGSRVVPGAFPNGIFNGIAVGENGSIYISEDVTNTVLEFKR